VLADNYIELAKGRLYTEGASRKSACRVLYTAVRLRSAGCLRRLSRTLPRKCYSYLHKGSVHKQPWVDFTFDDPAAKAEGDLLVKIVAEVRKYKHDKGLALNAPLGKVTVYAPHTTNDENDTARTINADVHWRTDKAHLDKVVSGIDFNRSVVGKTFRKDAAAFMAAVKALPPKDLEHPPKTIKVNGKDMDVPEGAFAPQYSYVEEGAKVDMITVGDVIVTVAGK